MPTMITIVPWTDPVIDTIGYDPRTRYAETFWLPVLGPTSTSREPIPARATAGVAGTRAKESGHPVNSGVTVTAAAGVVGQESVLGS
jgi:hypothetical protein